MFKKLKNVIDFHIALRKVPQAMFFRHLFTLFYIPLMIQIYPYVKTFVTFMENAFPFISVLHLQGFFVLCASLGFAVLFKELFMTWDSELTFKQYVSGVFQRIRFYTFLYPRISSKQMQENVIKMAQLTKKAHENTIQSFLRSLDMNGFSHMAIEDLQSMSHLLKPKKPETKSFKDMVQSMENEEQSCNFFEKAKQ